MKKIILLIALLSMFWLSLTHAQREVLSAGGDFSSAAGSVAFSIGQVAYTIASGTTGTGSQGVQQPNTFTIVATENPGEEWSMTLYPNPASEEVYVDLGDDSSIRKFNTLTIRLLDMQGKLLIEKEIKEVVTLFPLSELSEAVYLLQISHDDQILKTFKLYKAN